LATAKKFPDIKLYANDLNPGVVDFWDIVSDKDRTRVDRLIKDIEDIPEMTLDLWKEIKSRQYSALRFIVLNLTSYNGYIHEKSGPIGGMNQDGKKWTVNTLWKPDKLIQTIRSYHKLLSGRTTVALKDLFEDDLWSKDVFIYLDPPYCEQGGNLYQEFGQFDHLKLQDYLRKTDNPCILSYDIQPEIYDLYKDFHIIEVSGFSGAKHAEQMEYLISNRPFEGDQGVLF
jgi:DNA adenine methylase